MEALPAVSREQRSTRHETNDTKQQSVEQTRPLLTVMVTLNT